LKRAGRISKWPVSLAAVVAYPSLRSRGFQTISPIVSPFAVKQRDEANQDPRRTEIPVEIKQCEDKIDKIKRENEDDRMLLDMLRHTAEAQNAITVLREQAERELEGLQESLHDESYTLQKFHVQNPPALPKDGDEDGGRLIEIIEAIVDSIQDKHDSANAELSTAKNEISRTQQTVSEKSALLASSRQTLTSLRAKLSSLDGDTGSVGKVRKVVSDLVKHETEQGLAAPGVSEQNPRELLEYLDQRVEAVEEEAPNVESPQIAYKILKKLKKMVRFLVFLCVLHIANSHSVPGRFTG